MHLPRKKIINIVLISALSLVLGGTIFIANADEIIYGSVTVDPPIALENIIIHDGTTVQTSLNPDGMTLYYLNFTVNHPGGMKEINGLDVYWHSSTYVTNYNISAIDGTELVYVHWTENVEFGGFPTGIDEWTVDDAGYNEWNFGPNVDPGAGSSLTTFTFQIPFMISRAAVPENGWQVSIDITWDDASIHSGSSTTWTVLIRQSLSVSSNTLAWGNVIQNGGPVTASVNVTAYSNTQWSLEIKGADFLASGEPIVSIDAGSFVTVNSTDIVTSTFTPLTGFTLQSSMGETNGTTYTLVFSFDPSNWSGSYGVEYTAEITLKLVSG